MAASAPVPPTLRQRAEYTYSGNRDLGRHGWLRLTPAYSVKVVAELLEDVPSDATVLDPFCGTGTTALVAASLGHSAITTEINPFLVWYANAKVDLYSELDRIQAQELIDESIRHVYRNGHSKASPPPLFNIERWWGTKELQFLLAIKASFTGFGTDPSRRKAENLVKIAFCRTLIFLSNAAFNHQSMSFKDAPKSLLPFSDKVDLYVDALLDASKIVLHGAHTNPIGIATVVHGDARSVGTLLRHKVDLVITSPPYPNRMSYIRELRPYMYWLDFLTDAKEAAELDWQAIGGTWGSATSRLKQWTAEDSEYVSGQLNRAVSTIAHKGNLNGPLLAQYVAKYFHDLHMHIASLKTVLNPAATVHYVVGNSTFYGTLLPVESLYAEIFTLQGFENIAIKPLRKRNSKKELVEFCVSAVWKG